MTRSKQPQDDEFTVLIAELYLPLSRREQLLKDVVRVRRDTGAGPRERTRPRYLGSAYVPEDETCFLLFEGSDATEVGRALDAAAISYERVVQATCLPAGVTHPLRVRTQ